MLSRREARLVDFLLQFSIREFTLEEWRVHVLVDVFSRSRHVPYNGKANSVQSLTIEPPENVSDGYALDIVFGPVYKAMKGDWPEDKVQCACLSCILDLFTFDKNRLLYKGELCIPS